MQKALFVIALCISFQSTVAQDLLSQRKTEQCYSSAIELFQRNEFGGALNQFEAFLNISPSTDLRRIDAEYYLALCALNLYHIDGEKLIANFVEAHIKIGVEALKLVRRHGRSVKHLRFEEELD